ncbi:hypothetical protein DV735_g4200, partial [Chaetothyriales sp. CBS 134920]
MDQHHRPDTLSSGRFPEQWAFLSNPPALLPPRTIQAGSAGAPSSAATLPTQPVLLCINADASRHLHPAPRLPTQRPIMTAKGGELPSLQDCSFDGILATISEDVEDDFTAIGNILGRSRFVLADQHDSHLPPTGEIRASPLQAVAEASASNERLAADQVIIANDEASLIDGKIYLSAGAGGRIFSDPPVVSESGRFYPLYSYDESDIFESTMSHLRHILRQRADGLLTSAGDAATRGVQGPEDASGSMDIGFERHLSHDADEADDHDHDHDQHEGDEHSNLYD